MKLFTAKLVTLGLCIGTCLSAQATTLAKSVLPTETKTLLTVPHNRSAVIRSIIIANPGTAPVCTQQVLRGASVKVDLCVPAGASFQAEFSPALFFKRNESIGLKNGDSTTTTIFTINYRIIPPGKGLIEKEE